MSKGFTASKGTNIHAAITTIQHHISSNPVATGDAPQYGAVMYTSFTGDSNAPIGSLIADWGYVENKPLGTESREMLQGMIPVILQDRPAGQPAAFIVAIPGDALYEDGVASAWRCWVVDLGTSEVQVLDFQEDGIFVNELDDRSFGKFLQFVTKPLHSV